MPEHTKKITDPLVLAIVEEHARLTAENLMVREENKEAFTIWEAAQKMLRANGERQRQLEEAAISLGTKIT